MTLLFLNDKVQFIDPVERQTFSQILLACGIASYLGRGKLVVAESGRRYAL